MCSTDLHPNRLAVAQQAALQYVAHEPAGTKIGLVVFNGFAELVVAPTTSRAALEKAINNLTTGPGTAIGAALLQSLDAISQVDPNVASVGAAATIGGAAESNPFGQTDEETVKLTPERTPPRDGYVARRRRPVDGRGEQPGHQPLAGGAVRGQASRPRLHDRVRNDTSGAARLHAPAATGRVRSRRRLRRPGWRVRGRRVRGGFGGGFGRNPLVADLPPLEEVSRLTGGQSYPARTASQLNHVFAKLPKQITVQMERHEVTWESRSSAPCSRFWPSGLRSGGARTRSPEMEPAPVREGPIWSWYADGPHSATHAQRSTVRGVRRARGPRFVCSGGDRGRQRHLALSPRGCASDYRISARGKER